jgi:hyperosmotically inducible protein
MSSIQSKYYIDDRFRSRRINVTSSGGVVTLNGEVADEAQRSDALLLARTTDGVKRVEDGLTVTAPQPAEASAPAVASPSTVAPPDGDDTLSSRVKSQLSSDAQVSAASIDVSAKNGVVLLQGTVTSSAAKQRALTVARGTDGVTQVVDRLKVGKAAR